MKKYNNSFLLILFFGFWTTFVAAQPYAIGNLSITYNDPDRNNRSIPVQIFYPSDTPGQNVPVAGGNFPFIVFGHGFLMVYSAYQYLWQVLVPEGYILVFPTTEGNLFPSHQSFGLDLRFLNGKMKAEGNNPASLFFGHVSDSSAIMGHSMGGGVSFLACQNYVEVSALITFAAAETNPSAIQAAASIQIPSLVFSGSNDCVTPPPDHQIPMFNNLSSSCKTFISITGGGHCYFADYNFNCAFGEATCSPSPTITREQQHSIILSHLLPYLEFTLKGNQQSWIEFNNLLNNPNGITSLQSCNIRLVSFKVLLEGPFSDMEMNTQLDDLGLLPLAQPYFDAPWFYAGQESVENLPDENIVDWILLELRDATDAASANASTIISRKAAFLLGDGSIMDVSGTNILRFDVEIQNQLYVAVHHRNHLPVMSSANLIALDGLYSYDFTSGPNQAFGTDAQKDLGSGVFGMFAGDLNADKVVDINDKINYWDSNAGNYGYLLTDGNLDGQADNQDKNEQWEINLGQSSQIPE